MNCIRCGTEIHGRAGIKKYCPDCAKERKKEAARRRYRADPKHCSRIAKESRDRNIETFRRREREQYKKHHAKKLERSRKYRETHRTHNCDVEILRRYGLTPGQYQTKLANQNGVCAVCGQTNSNGRRLYVDHDHSTDELRDLLCHHCNLILGHCKEDPGVLLKLIEYIAKWHSLLGTRSAA